MIGAAGEGNWIAADIVAADGIVAGAAEGSSVPYVESNHHGIEDSWEGIAYFQVH